ERDKVRGIYAVPIALLVGAFFNHLTSGLCRAGPFGPGIGGAGRYFGLTVAMMLPFIALSFYLIARKGRVVGALALIVLVMGIPGNISLLFSQTDNRATSIDRARTIILALP